MKKTFLISFLVSTLLALGTGCKNKKPNSSVDNTVETPPPPPTESTPLDNNISLVNDDSLMKVKNIAAAKAAAAEKLALSKKALAEKNKKAAAKTEKGKTASTKIPVPAKANAATKASVPAKGSKPMSRPISKTDNFPDDKIIKRKGKDDVLKTAEAAPTYGGGESAMRKYLQKNIKYPSKAKDDGVQGTVFVRFVVEKNGTVDDVLVAKGVHPLLDEEAKRVVSAMPKWAPGKERGKNVAVQYTLPVRFQLMD
jgi:periplasmic protein TonB